MASFPEEIPGDDLIQSIHADGCRPRPRRHPAGGSKPLGDRASALCTSLPRLRSAQFERSSAIGRLLCRGPARGQPGRDSILRSTRADALHSTSPRFGNTSASRCSGHGTWKNSKLGRLERALEHDAPKVLFHPAHPGLGRSALVSSRCSSAERRGRGSAEGIGSEQDPTRQLGRTPPGGRLTQVGLGDRIAPDFEAPGWRKRERLVPSPPRSRAPLERLSASGTGGTRPRSERREQGERAPLTATPRFATVTEWPGRRASFRSNASPRRST